MRGAHSEGRCFVSEVGLDELREEAVLLEALKFHIEKKHEKSTA